jgi:signal peptidase II
MVGVIILVTIAVDQLSKYLAPLVFQVSFNPGISFGWLQMLPSWALTAALIGCTGIIWWLGQAFWSQHSLLTGLFFGGAVSNIIDRLIWGAVRDWLPLPFTTIHNNLADYALAAAVLLIAYELGLKKHHAHSDSV